MVAILFKPIYIPPPTLTYVSLEVGVLRGFFDKKIEELEKMTEDVIQEAKDVEQHKKNIYQKSLDDEAMMFMPVKRKEK